MVGIAWCRAGAELMSVAELLAEAELFAEACPTSQLKETLTKRVVGHRTIKAALGGEDEKNKR